MGKGITLSLPKECAPRSMACKRRAKVPGLPQNPADRKGNEKQGNEKRLSAKFS
jgi:hypothetical protein